MHAAAVTMNASSGRDLFAGGLIVRVIAEAATAEVGGNADE